MIFAPTDSLAMVMTDPSFHWWSKELFVTVQSTYYKGRTYGCHPEVREANNEGSARDCSKQHDPQRKDPSLSLRDVQDDSAGSFFKQTGKMLTGFYLDGTDTNIFTYSFILKGIISAAICPQQRKL